MSVLNFPQLPPYNALIMRDLSIGRYILRDFVEAGDIPAAPLPYTFFHLAHLVLAFEFADLL